MKKILHLVHENVVLEFQKENRAAVVQTLKL